LAKLGTKLLARLVGYQIKLFHPKSGHVKKNWHLFGWNPKSSLPSKTANDLVKKIGMPTFW